MANRLILITAFLGCLLPGTAAELPSFERAAAEVILKSKAIDEASGLAASFRDDHFLWIVNDSGAEAVLHLTDRTGADRGKLSVTGAKNIDWEALASFETGGDPYLLIADVGDNNSVRNFCTLYLVREPGLPRGDAVLKGNVPVLHAIRFRYEDGPRDCESVAVDAAEGKILLISKRTKPPMIYELPLRLSGRDEILTARRIGETSVQPPPSARFLPYIDQPTGLDISRDRSLAAVVTYYGIFLFPRGSDESWAEAFAKAPRVLSSHLLPQAEAIAFSKDGKSIRIVSEGINTPIVRYGK